MINSSESLFVKKEQSIAWLTFAHPKGNCLTKSLLTRLAQSFDELSKDATIKAIVVQSEGEKTFCSGAALHELLAVSNLEEATDFFSGFAQLLNAMRTCTKVIVGSVQGKSVGGALGLIAACDYVLASEDAAIKLSELSIGIGPFVIAPALERKIGISAFTQLSLDAKHWQNAYWAKDKGLFHRVFDNQKELTKGVQDFTQDLSSYSYEALSALKKCFWEAPDTKHWETLLFERAKITASLALSAETQEKLKNFK